MRYVFLVLAACICQSLNAQPIYTSGQAAEDLQHLITFIKENHPDLEIHAPDFDRKSQEIVQHIDGPLDAFELFKKISAIATLAKENHYDLGNWEDEVHAGILDNSFAYFPFYVRVLDNGVFVYRNLSNKHKIKPGDRIISINGRSIEDILEELYRHIPSDADIETYRQRLLGLTFGWMYYLYIERPESFDIQFARGGEAYGLTVAAQTNEEFVANYKSNPNGPESPNFSGPDEVYSFVISDDHALLTLRSFSRGNIEEFNIKSKKLYKEIFRRLEEENIANFIVDLRNNTGGRNEFADDLLPYINRHGAEGIYKTSISWEGKVREYKLPGPDKYVFQGNIYVLVNGRTYSNGSTVARSLREYADAVIIGEESGTRYEGFVAGSKNSVILPNSGFRINVPRYAYRFPPSTIQTERDRGLLPDHIVKPSMNDILNQKDPVMEYALKLIE
ncbi:MAG: S41 family peptidase [Cyclobacteriaceae bacterium]